MVQCNLCSLSFSHNQALNEHMLDLHSVECPFGCEECGKHFKRKCNLAQHKLVHGGTKCRYCKVMFRDLQSHLRTPCCQSAFNANCRQVADRGSAEEENENKSSTDEQSLSSENDSSSDEEEDTEEIPKSKPALQDTFCDVCQKVFAAKRSLKEHKQRLHSETRPVFQCTICGLSYTAKRTLDAHVRLKHANGMSTCYVFKCYKIFKTTIELSQHVATDHADQYECNDCGKMCPSRRALKYHILEHNKAEIACHLCQKKFPGKRRLNIHLRKSHNVLQTDSNMSRKRKLHVEEEMDEDVPEPLLVQTEGNTREQRKRRRDERKRRLDEEHETIDEMDDDEVFEATTPEPDEAEDEMNEDIETKELDEVPEGRVVKNFVGESADKVSASDVDPSGEDGEDNTATAGDAAGNETEVTQEHEVDEMNDVVKEVLAEIIEKIDSMAVELVENQEDRVMEKNALGQVEKCVSETEMNEALKIQNKNGGVVEAVMKPTEETAQSGNNTKKEHVHKIVDEIVMEQIESAENYNQTPDAQGAHSLLIFAEASASEPVQEAEEDVEMDEDSVKKAAEVADGSKKLILGSEMEHEPIVPNFSQLHSHIAQCQASSSNQSEKKRLGSKDSDAGTEMVEEVSSIKVKKEELLNGASQEDVQAPVPVLVSVMKRSNKKPKEPVCCNEPSEFYRYGTENINCNGSDDCKIAPRAKYMQSGLKVFCMSCWNDPHNIPSHRVKRSSYKPKFNVNPNKESTPKCTNCERFYHAECVYYVKELNIPFACQECHGPQLGTTVDFVPRNDLDNMLQERCNGLKGVEDAIVSVVSFLSNFDKIVPEDLVANFKEEWFKSKEQTDQMEFKIRSIYVFQRLDGVDTPFLIIYTQEYSTKRTCIIDYLDTVSITSPSKLKPIVCEAVVLGYFEYMKSIGYSNCHFWAKPPIKYDGYVFHVHPERQNYLNQAELEAWYKSILKKGVLLRIIQEFHDFEKEYAIKKYSNPMQFPIFKDSLWATEIGYAAGDESPEYSGNIMKYLMEKSIPKHLHDNFYVTFKDANLEVIDDDLRSNAVMGSRGGFVNYCREQNLEFSTPRRAKFAAVYIINHVLRAVFDN